MADMPSVTIREPWALPAALPALLHALLPASVVHASQVACTPAPSLGP